MGDAAGDAEDDAVDLDAFDEAPDRPAERLDVADLPPPEPLTATLEAAEALDDEVLLQTTDRVPQHLYPELEDRGYAWETVDGDGDAVHTAIWRERD